MYSVSNFLREENYERKNKLLIHHTAFDLLEQETGFAWLLWHVILIKEKTIITIKKVKNVNFKKL